MSAAPRTSTGLQSAVVLLREAGLNDEYLDECERGHEVPSDLYDRLAGTPNSSHHQLRFDQPKEKPAMPPKRPNDVPGGLDELQVHLSIDNPSGNASSTCAPSTSSIRAWSQTPTVVSTSATNTSSSRSTGVRCAALMRTVPTRAPAPCIVTPTSPTGDGARPKALSWGRSPRSERRHSPPEASGNHPHHRNRAVPTEQEHLMTPTRPLRAAHPQRTRSYRSMTAHGEHSAGVGSRVHESHCTPGPMS